MPFTGQLGTADSAPGNIVPGLSSASPPPPPPPATPAGIRAFTIPAGVPIRHPVNKGVPVPHKPPLPLDGPPGAVVQAYDNAQIKSFGMVHAPVPGPWNQYKMVPVRVEFNAISEAGVTPFSPPAVPSQILPTQFSRTTPSPGPWNHFGAGRPLPAKDYPAAPPPPGVPPVVPPGQEFGPTRRQLPSVPRAPLTSDDRVRPHIDTVSQILNDLIRLGYLRVTSGGYAVAGGGISLPRPPSVNDDSTVGAVVGMNYIDTLNQVAYVCMSNAVGAAVWRQITA